MDAADLNTELNVNGKSERWDFWGIRDDRGSQGVFVRMR
jgi:hypothetical protein